MPPLLHPPTAAASALQPLHEDVSGGKEKMSLSAGGKASRVHIHGMFLTRSDYDRGLLRAVVPSNHLTLAPCRCQHVFSRRPFVSGYPWRRAALLYHANLLIRPLRSSTRLRPSSSAPRPSASKQQRCICPLYSCSHDSTTSYALLCYRSIHHCLLRASRALSWL